MQKFDDTQLEAINKLYNSTINALHHGKPFYAVVSGGPGTGKTSCLIELLIALVRSDAFAKKPIKILVTGAHDDIINSAATLLHKTRESMHTNIGNDLLSIESEFVYCFEFVCMLFTHYLQHSIVNRNAKILCRFKVRYIWYGDA